MAKRKSAKKSDKAMNRAAEKNSSGRNPVAVTSQKASEPGGRWTFLTNHSHVLVLLDADEPPVLREVALRIGITERAVQRIIQDLEEGGFIERERVGRRNRYRVMRDQQLRHSIESHRTIGDLLDLVTSDA